MKRRAPMLRSASWALLIGALSGVIFGGVQVYWLGGGEWVVLGALAGLLLGPVVGCDLLIPGPPPRSSLESERGDRVGPFRLSILLLLLVIEGLIFGAYLWGSVTLTCERLTTETSQTPQVDCRRITTGWFHSQQTSETIYDNVIGVGLDVHNELLLQHGPYEQSRSASGFGVIDMAAVQTFLDEPIPALTLEAMAWTIRLGSPACFLIALVTATWAFFSFRRGWSILREQFALGEVYWGWRAP